MSKKGLTYAQSGVDIDAGNRPVNDEYEMYRNDPHFRDLILFYEYFHGDSGKGLGANHQTGWTALVAQLISEYNEPTT